MIRIGFWGVHYAINYCIVRNPQNSRGNYEGPYIVLSLGVSTDWKYISECALNSPKDLPLMQR